MTYKDTYVITVDARSVRTLKVIYYMTSSNTDMSLRVPFESDDVLGAFFKALVGNDLRGLYSTHIPHSDVFFVREKYFKDTGHWVSLDRMERSMYLEGMLEAYTVHEPNRKRDWE